MELTTDSTTDTNGRPWPLLPEAVAIAPDGGSFAALAGLVDLNGGDEVVLWDFQQRVARKRPLPPLPLPQPSGREATAGPEGLTYTPDGAALLVWGYSGLVYVLGVPDLRVVGTFAWRRLGAFSFEGAVGGDWLVTAAEDATLRFTPWRPFVEYARRRDGG